MPIVLDMDNESHTNKAKIILDEDEAIIEAMRKNCIVAYY